MVDEVDPQPQVVVHNLDTSKNGQEDYWQEWKNGSQASKWKEQIGTQTLARLDVDDDDDDGDDDDESKFMKIYIGEVAITHIWVDLDLRLESCYQKNTMYRYTWSFNWYLNCGYNNFWVTSSRKSSNSKRTLEARSQPLWSR